jgi:glyoxylase-like metal-dependent hydrolase (beta-lactamase superfamily II)
VSIPFVQDAHPHAGKAQSVSPLITRVLADNPGPFTYTGTGVFIIGAGKHVCVIDPGPDRPAHREALWRALEGKQVTAILLTHHHRDHSPLARPLAEQHGCKVFGKLPTPTSEANPDIQMEEGIDPGFALDHELSDGELITGPDFTLMTLATPGHTSNHLCFALIEENALFTGDHIMGWATSVVIPPDGDMGEYMQSLRKVRSIGFATLYPTHGAPITEPASFLDAYITHRETREAQIKDTLTAGPHAIMEIVKTLYTHIDPRLHPAAAMSVLSHLIHLREQGLAREDGAKWIRT